MTKRDLATIGVRLMAILAILYGVHSLTMPLGNLIRGGRYSSPQNTGFLNALMQEQTAVLVVTFGPFLALSALAILLWCFSTPLGFLIAGRNGSETGVLTLALSPSDALVLLFSTLGLYLVVTGAPPLVNLGGSLLLRASVPAPYAGLYTTERLIPEAASAMCNCVVGGLLLFGARFLAHLLPSTRPLMTRSQTAVRGVAEVEPTSAEEGAL